MLHPVPLVLMPAARCRAFRWIPGGALMLSPRSTEKRRRAAAFAIRPGPTPTVGSLVIQWASAFDRSCFLVSTPGLSLKHQRPYDQLIKALTDATGCTVSEILAHGSRVRAVLVLADNRLTQSDAPGHSVGVQRHSYELRPVPPRF